MADLQLFSFLSFVEKWDSYFDYSRVLVFKSEGDWTAYSVVGSCLDLGLCYPFFRGLVLISLSLVIFLGGNMLVFF